MAMLAGVLAEAQSQKTLEKNQCVLCVYVFTSRAP
jgi:hypothetical protein